MNLINSSVNWMMFTGIVLFVQLHYNWLKHMGLIKKDTKTFTFKFIIIPTFIFHFPCVYFNRITLKKHFRKIHILKLLILSHPPSIQKCLGAILKREKLYISKILLDTNITGCLHRMQHPSYELHKMPHYMPWTPYECFVFCDLCLSFFLMGSA